MKKMHPFAHASAVIVAALIHAACANPHAPPSPGTTAGAAVVTAVGKVVMPDERQQKRIGRIGRKMLR